MKFFSKTQKKYCGKVIALFFSQSELSKLEDLKKEWDKWLENWADQIENAIDHCSTCPPADIVNSFFCYFDMDNAKFLQRAKELTPERTIAFISASGGWQKYGFLPNVFSN